ncbi:MAG: flagellar basal body-associated FliL family protein [Nitrospirota bacterium]|nr:flagellar basal body-associated FliL family protein [Nitrospirota bacterium]
MAEETEEKTEAAEAPPEKKKKSKKPLLIIILVVVSLLLGGGGFFAWKMFFSKKTGEHPAEEAPKKVEDLKLGTNYPLESLIVNLADPGGKRYLKITIHFEMSDVKLKDEMDMRKPQVQDMLITLLSSKTYEEIGTVVGKKLLRQEILNIVNSRLKLGQVKDVFFTEFVIQ